jgi:hypothetical protein
LWLTSGQATTPAARTTHAAMAKIQRHENQSVITPPTSGPMANDDA